jgi:hypothetical protein
VSALPTGNCVTFSNQSNQKVIGAQILVSRDSRKGFSWLENGVFLARCNSPCCFAAFPFFLTPYAHLTGGVACSQDSTCRAVRASLRGIWGCCGFFVRWVVLLCLTIEQIGSISRWVIWRVYINFALHGFAVANPYGKPLVLSYLEIYGLPSSFVFRPSSAHSAITSAQSRAQWRF